MKEKYFCGQIETPAGLVPVVATSLSLMDKLGAWLVRCAILRNNYRVKPGLYATGSPTDNSPVMVSANYKLSFDMLRHALDGIDSWILVLDTKGVNVWCAAGKGTFGTEEIVRRIDETGLAKIARRKKLVVPQLAAPGVSAIDVKKLSGFSVEFGPVRAEDLPAFLLSGGKASAEMRTVKFEMGDRVKLIPAEIMIHSGALFMSIAVFFLLSGLGPGGYLFSRARDSGVFAVTFLLAAFFSGTVLSTILLPWLPGRSFSLKGAFAGLLTLGLLFLSSGSRANNFELFSWLLLVPSISSFLAMNFTGASTFTSLSGVKKEMRIAVPVQAVSAIAGMALWAISRFV
ncbi:MAG: mercury methylation corrinoid protein HgcA [Elusimicrobiota bacterium]|nr:mercury methylation corrinoid protein HgcA [Elusimicrobiota bacterium]